MAVALQSILKSVFEGIQISAAAHNKKHGQKMLNILDHGCTNETLTNDTKLHIDGHVNALTDVSRRKEPQIWTSGSVWEYCCVDFRLKLQLSCMC